MSTSTIPDPTDEGTLRPNVPPLRDHGSQFIPLDLPDFKPKITLLTNVSPNNPITLFTLFYSPKIIDLIVQHTNNVVRQPQDPTKPKARALKWYPTCQQEIYLFLGICIYMTLFPMDEIADYWSTNEAFPSHPITTLMTRDRFQELRMRYRVAPPRTRDLFGRVS